MTQETALKMSKMDLGLEHDFSFFEGGEPIFFLRA